jgi:hypothetical protein
MRGYIASSVCCSSFNVPYSCIQLLLLWLHAKLPLPAEEALCSSRHTSTSLHDVQASSCQHTLAAERRLQATWVNAVTNKNEPCGAAVSIDACNLIMLTCPACMLTHCRSCRRFASLSATALFGSFTKSSDSISTTNNSCNDTAEQQHDQATRERLARQDAAATTILLARNCDAAQAAARRPRCSSSSASSSFSCKPLAGQTAADQGDGGLADAAAAGYVDDAAPAGSLGVPGARLLLATSAGRGTFKFKVRDAVRAAAWHSTGLALVGSHVGALFAAE